MRDFKIYFSKKIIITGFLVLSVFTNVFFIKNNSLNFIFAEKIPETEENWVLAFSEFGLEEVPKLYEFYSKIVPELLSYNLNPEAKRIVPFEEKKARKFLLLSQKKLKAISELNNLILEKDKIFLFPETEKKKKRKIKNLEKKIKKKKKEIELLSADIKIEELNTTYTDVNEAKKISQWKDGKLFALSKEKPLAADLADNKINALVTGTVKDVSGYVVVTAKLQTGLAKIPEITVTEAGNYENMDSIIKVLANLLYANIQSLPERKIFFETEPADTKIFINESLIADVKKPLTVYSDDIEVFASAKGYEDATKNFNLGKEKTYKLKIKLKEAKTSAVSINIPKGTKIFSDTQKLETKNKGGSETLTLENKKSILEFETEDGIRTYVIMDPDKFAVSDSVKSVQAKFNTNDVSKQIKKQRSVMYWSLAGVYVSLPITLILAGIHNDKTIAYETGRLPQNQASLQKIKNLSIGKNTMIGVTSALAVNYFVQVILYLVKADLALPQNLKY